MNWYYVDAGQQAGPVDDGLLTALVSSGKIQPDTLVWHEGMPNWLAYRDAVPIQPPPPVTGVPPVAGSPAAGGGLICCECGKTFEADQVIRHGDKWVCATCKPIFLQRLREGAVPGGAIPRGMASEAEILARDYDVDIGQCLSRAWEMYKSDPGIIIGASLLAGLALMGSGAIPYLGIILSLVFRGPLMGGVWNFYIKKVRGQSVEIGDAFAGFGPKFGQLFLTQLVPFLIMFAGVFVLAIPIALMAAFAKHNAGQSSTNLPVFLIPVIIFGIIFVILMMYINVCWIFAVPLVMDKGMKFWPALELSRKVVNKHWWMTFLFFMVSGLLGAVGFIACCVGLLVTGPVAFGAWTFHYEKVFGDLAPSQN